MSITYEICNNYNVCETRTSDYNEAVELAQAIANRDNMPAWIDFSDPSQTTIRVNPNVSC